MHSTTTPLVKTILVLGKCIQKARTKNTHARYFVLDHPVSMSDKIECTNMPTKRAHAQWTLTHAASCIFQRMQWHQGVRSQCRARRCRRRSGAVDNTLTAITQTHQTNRTKYALNVGHRVGTSNAGSMRVSPGLTPHVLYAARAPAVWMGRTCQRCRGWSSVLTSDTIVTLYKHQSTNRFISHWLLPSRVS